MFQRCAILALPEYNFGHPSLKQPFGVATAIAPQSALKAEDIKVTTMPNGARIITQNRFGPHVTLGTYVEAGPKFDPLTTPGLSYVFRWALTTSNIENSLFQIDRTIRATGSSLEHTEVCKRHIGVRIDARADMWKAPFENILTTISVPRFAEQDIERFRDTMDNQLEEMRWQHPRRYCIDQLETIAYFKEPLGMPRHVGPEANSKCNHKALVEFWNKHCTPKRVVVAGINVDHQSLIAAYENAPFPHSEESPHHSRSDKYFIEQNNELKQYTGGKDFMEQEDRAYEMCTKPDMNEETIAALGFRCYGREGELRDYAAALVSEQAFNILIKDSIRYDRVDTHKGIRAFYRPYSTTGLIGFTAQGEREPVHKMVKEALGLAKKLSSAEVENAKVMAAVDFYNERLEVARDYCDYLGTSFAPGKDTFVHPNEIFEAIKGVSAEDLKRVESFINEAPPCIWVTGDTFAFPSLKQLMI